MWEPNSAHFLGDTRKGLGDLLVESRRLDEAERAYRRAVQSLEKLLPELPANSDSRALLAHCDLKLIATLRLQGKKADAEKVLRDASAVLGQTRDHDSVAAAYEQVADWYRNAGRISDAIDARRSAVAAREKLAATNDPDQPWRLASDYGILSDLLNQQKNTKEAEANLQKAVAVWEKLVAGAPTNPKGAEYRRKLADALYRIGDASNQAGEAVLAESAFEKAVAPNRGLATEFPKEPRYRWALGHSLRMFSGFGERRPDGLTASERAGAEAKEVFAQLLLEFPNNPDCGLPGRHVHGTDQRAATPRQTYGGGEDLR